MLLKKTYPVTHLVDGKPTVLRSFPAEWMANLYAEFMSLADADLEGLEVAVVTLRPQDIINICRDRDRFAAEADELRAKMSAGHPAQVCLFGLVARTDEGGWETVHDAGYRLSDDDAAAVERALG